MDDQVLLAARLAVAALVGLAVGIERERSGHATGPGARFAGVRTFFLYGLLGGIGGAFARAGYAAAATALLAGGAALAVTAYFTATRRQGEGDAAHPALDGTTETAALTVLALSALAGFGELSLAAGAGALVVFALGEKTRIQGLVQRFGAREFEAALQFAVLALVVLPLLPAGPIERLGGLEPRALWILVLLISGLNFTAYVARRLVGRTRGALVAGALGGLLSSTLTTLTCARESRRAPDDAAALGAGAVAASTVMPMRVLLVSFLLQPRVAGALVPYVVAPVAAGLLFFGVLARRGAPAASAPAPAPADEGSPLRLAMAIRLTLVFQLGLWLIGAIRTHLGTGSLLAGAVLLGLVDMDALTAAMAKVGADPAQAALAALGIACGIAADPLLKAGIAAATGAPAYRRRVLTGLVVELAALGGAIAAFGRAV